MSLLTGNNYQTHKVFVSYQHTEADQYYRNVFENYFAGSQDVFISKSVQIGDIDSNLSTDYVRQKIRDEYLRDSTVTIVLVGPTTWQRRHVDWEISSSIRDTKLNSRSGLIGILLPNHPSYGKEGYDGGIVPPRLEKNEQCRFAKIYDWTTNPESLKNWIHDAFERRKTHEPDNSYPHFVNNKISERWQ